MAVDLMEMLKGAVSQQVMGKIGGNVGLDEKQTSSVFETLSGAILGGLIKKSSTPEGAQTVYDEAQKQDNDILDKLGDLLGGDGPDEELTNRGGGLLETILGDGQAGILETLAKAVGLDKDIIKKIASMVVPIIMAVIGRHLKAKAMDAVGLGKLMDGQKEHLNKYMPASLAGNLGFDNLLSSASETVGGAADSVAAAGRSTSHAAAETAAQGGGLLKMLVPVILLALVAWGVWKFVINKPAEPGNGTDNNVVANSNEDDESTKPLFDFSKIDLSALGGEQAKTLKDGFSDITSGLKDVQTEEGANNLVEQISGFSTKVEDMNFSDLPEAAQGPLSKLIDGFRAQIDAILAKVPDALKPIVQPAIDGLLEKLSGIGG